MAALSQLLSLTDDLICIVDENGRIKEVNSNWKKMVHVPPVGEELFEVIEEEDAGNELRSFFHSSQMSMLKINSCRLKGSLSGQVWVDLRIKKIPTQDKYWCLLRDITARKFRNTVFESIADACKLGYWKYHSGSDELMWSEKVYDIFRKSPLFYRPQIRDFRMSLPENVLTQLRELKTSDLDITFETQVDGVSKWIRLKGKKETFEDGSYEYQGIVQDVTLEVLKEKVHLSSNIELSSFEKGLDEFSIVARTDAKGRIIQANKEFCRISKYTEEELIGKDHRIVNSGHHPKSFFADMWKCIREGKNWRGEIKNKAKDGTYYWVDTIIIPIRNSSEELVEILSFRFEITQLKKAQEEVRILREQLENLNHAHSSFTWCFDFVENRFYWNSKLCTLFDCPQDASFEDVVAKMSEEDQQAVHAFLKDTRQARFVRNVFFNGNDVQLSFKAIRDAEGKILKAEGICSLVGHGPSPRKETVAVA